MGPVPPPNVPLDCCAIISRPNSALVSPSALRTLVLYARRVPGLRGSLVETLGARIGALKEVGKARSWMGKLLPWLDRNAYDSLSYVNDWLQAFREARDLTTTALNITDLWQLAKAGVTLKGFDLIVILHSAAGDDLSALRWLAPALKDRKSPLVIFFGNEYTRMPEKIGFARAVAADYVASQLPPEAAQWLYEEIPGTRLIHAPHALNPMRYYPMGVPRDVSIGFRGDRYPLWIGDTARTRLIEWFAVHGQQHGLAVDIQFRREPGEKWNRFLNGCQGIIGAESGTAFLERDDRTQRAVDTYLAAHPHATFEAVYEQFFRDYGQPVSGKAISSRHFEPIGTRTCQILLEGAYNGLLTADRHYLAVRSDFSNLEEVVTRFQDPSIRLQISEAAWEHVQARHTYAHRVSEILKTIVPIL